MLILNSGGTFNKRYNMVAGTVDVPYDNQAVEEILQSTYGLYKQAGVVYKDSLEMTFEDRKMIASIISESQERCFILIHGTDTMHQTAEFLSEVFDDRVIVLTGSMKPFEIDKIEATLNLGIAIGFLQAEPASGVYITMNGLLSSWEKIEKNRAEGKFELV